MTLENKRKTVLVVSQYFWPEDFRVNELVVGLMDRGCDVEVLTGKPNYPSGSLFKEFKENPERFSSYRDAKIHRVWQISRGKTIFGLLANYLSFVITSCLYCLLRLRSNKYDVVFAVQLSPIFSVIPAILCKKMYEIPLHFWVLDIWPDSLSSTRFSATGTIYSVLETMCRAIYSSADVIFLSSRGFRKRLTDMGINNDKLVDLPQWVEKTYEQKVALYGDIDSEVKSILSRWTGKKMFMFAGNIGEAQNLKNVLLGFKNSNCLDELVFLILGDGRHKAAIQEDIRSLGLTDQVFCLGRYPSKYMPFFYYYANFLVFSLKDVPIFALTLPGKLQSYMNSGTPIIGMVNGEAAVVINEAMCGQTVRSGDVEGFATLVDDCCASSVERASVLGENGKRYAIRNYSFNAILDKLMRFL